MTELSINAPSDAKAAATPSSLMTISQSDYARLASRAKVLSFDVFDTLIHRRVLLPRDVFDIVGLRIGIEDFGEQRFAAEARARKLARPATFEVSLDEIYEAFPDGFLSDKDRAKQTELEVENELTFANEAMKSLVAEYRASGVRVIAISDIYLTKEQVGALLMTNGIEVDAIYTSCDFRQDNLGKYNGAIFPIVCEQEQIEPEELLHAGDHSGSDVASALGEGLVAVQTAHPNSYLTTNCEEFAAIAGEYQSLSSSLVAGTIGHSKLTDQSKLNTSIERYGYDFGGPLVVGMVAHMLQKCREQKIDHLVLLARDGCVVGDVLDALKIEEITYRIVPSSRRLSVFPAYADGGLGKITSLFAGQKRTTKRHILSVLRLEHLADGMENLDEPMSIRTAFDQMDSVISHQAESERVALLETLKPEREMLKNGKMFAWVDVGWALSSPTRLNEMLDHDIPGFFVGSRGDANPSPGFDGYLFTVGKPHNLAKVAMRSVELFELIFADSQPSSAYLRQTDDGVEIAYYDKSPAETVRDVHINAARSGVRQFAEDFRPLFNLTKTEDLREYNRKIWHRVCSNPPSALYKSLGVIPHDNLAGTKTWRTIGELWLPNWRYDTPDRKSFPTSRAYRIAYIRRFLKWNLPPSILRAFRFADEALRKYL